MGRAVSNSLGRQRSIRLNPPSLSFSPEEGPRSYFVQGKKASSYEWNVAQALDKLEIPYFFQFELFGGRSVRGGIIIDFLVLTRPLSTPLWVNGGFWHRGNQTTKDRLQQALVYWIMRGELNRAVIFWDQDCNTPDAALSSVRREFL